MRADAGDHVGEPGFGLDAVETCRSNECVEAGGALASLVGAAEKPIFSSDRCWPDLIFGGIVRYFEATIVEVTRQLRPARAGVADRAGEIAPAGDLL